MPYVENSIAIDPWDSFKIFNDEFLPPDSDELFSEQEKFQLIGKIDLFPSSFTKYIEDEFNQKFDDLENKLTAEMLEVKELIRMGAKRSTIKRYFVGTLIDIVTTESIKGGFSVVFQYLINFLKNWNLPIPPVLGP